MTRRISISLFITILMVYLTVAFAVRAEDLVKPELKRKTEVSSGITDLGEPVSGAGNIWDLTIGKDGKIYGGTGMLYNLFVYDPLTGNSKNLGPPGFEWYSITTGEDGLIYGGGSGCGLGFWEHPGVSAHFGVYDPSKPWNPGIEPESNPRDMGPAVLMPDGSAPPGNVVIYDLAMGKDGKIYGGTGYSGWEGYDYTYLFVYNPHNPWNPRFASENNPYAIELPIPNQGMVYRLTTGHDGKIYGAVNPSGHLFVYDAKENTVSVLCVPVEGELIGALTTGIDGNIYGGTYVLAKPGKGNFFFYNPHTGVMEVKEPAPGEGGLCTMTTGRDGKIYGGTDLGYLIIYAPKKPWKSGSNPRSLGRAVEGEVRIRSLITGKDGMIYGGTGFGAHLFKYIP